MKGRNNKIVHLLWAVIAVLVVGSTIAGVMLIGKVNDLTQTNASLNADIISLKEQVKEAKASTTPSTAALPTAGTSPSPAASSK